MELRIGLPGRASAAPPAEMDGDSLVIDCRGCELTPVPGSDECIRCMVERMCETGGAERVVLRTGLDTEISGRAGRVLKEVASLRRWSIPTGRPRGRCRSCPVSRAAVMGDVWRGFPQCDLEGRAADLLAMVPDREGCPGCVGSTVRAMRQLSEGLEGIEGSMGTGRSGR